MTQAPVANRPLSSIRSLRVLRDRLAAIDVQANLASHLNQAPPGVTQSEVRSAETFTVTRTVEDGIERVAVVPRQPRHQTPLLLQHGMWHGAWCWRWWQELLATWGWESHAFSLPGHGDSPAQRPIADCTLDYYLGFLAAEVARLPTTPVVIGHSMGGALLQWYLKYVGPLPAAVLVASWLSHSVSGNSPLRILMSDPWGFIQVVRQGTATPLVRSPQRAAKMFITEGAVLSPQELYAKIGPESRLVLLQHHAPLWHPPTDVTTPLLWIGAEQDAVISAPGARRSAEFYHATYLPAPRAGHDVMLEQDREETALAMARWLEQKAIA